MNPSVNLRVRLSLSAAGMLCVAPVALAQTSDQSSAQATAAAPATAVVPAQAPTTIAAQVISVSGSSAFINVGRNAGVTPGARVVFLPTDGRRIEATIADATASSARAELADPDNLPAIGDKAQVEVEPAKPAPAAVETTSKPKPPEHPPWTRKEGERDPDKPLLAPAFGTAPEDRPTTVRGRIFSLFRTTRDLENDSTSTYLRAGTWLEIKNPFKDGGRILFEADADYRNFDTSSSNDSDTNARIKRFSYAWGIDQHAPLRGEVGRFYSYYLPEVGIVDGGELAIRFADGWNFGGGVGLYPTTTDDLIKGDDYGFHAFADYQSEAKESWFQSTLGFQQTFHEGETDRSLVIGRVNARPNKDLSVFALVLLDLYDSSDINKSQAAEITQLTLSTSYLIDEKTGVQGTMTRTTWPELKRDEFANIPPELLSDGYVNRVSGTVWRKIGDDVRLSARAHYWMDQDRTGMGGEASADWSPKGDEHPSYYASLYYEDSSYIEGFGARLQARRDLGPFRAFLGYDAFAYTTSTLFGSDGDFLRHTIRGSLGWGKGPWSCDTELGYTFGDSEESLSLSAYVQYRF